MVGNFLAASFCREQYSYLDFLCLENSRSRSWSILEQEGCWDLTEDQQPTQQQAEVHGHTHNTDIGSPNDAHHFVV